jgi:two-component system chemotaxis response regulator CheY
MISAAMSSRGYRVVEAESAAAALDQVSAVEPDVVLLDLVMKGMYGLEVLAKLRELDPAARIIVVSADVQTSSQDLVRDAGGVAFLNKPVGPQQIVDSVSSALERRS